MRACSRATLPDGRQALVPCWWRLQLAGSASLGASGFKIIQPLQCAFGNTHARTCTRTRSPTRSLGIFIVAAMHCVKLLPYRVAVQRLQLLTAAAAH